MKADQNVYLLPIILLRTYYIVVPMEENAFLVLTELRKPTVKKSTCNFIHVKCSLTAVF